MLKSISEKKLFLLDMDGTIFHRDRGDMLFPAGLHSVGHQLIHLLAAAHHRHACVMDLYNQVAAVAAVIKSGLMHNCPP